MSTNINRQLIKPLGFHDTPTYAVKLFIRVYLRLFADP